MFKKYYILPAILLCCLFSVRAVAQQNRIAVLQHRLDSLSEFVPGLKQDVQLQINGSIQQYLAGIASVNNLNLSVDPKLTFNVNDNLNGVSAENVLIFLAKKYNLDFSVVGSIIYVTAYVNPDNVVKPVADRVDAKYNPKNNTLSLSLHNDSLLAVAKKVSELSGKNVIVPDAMNSKMVSGFIESAPFEEALDKMAFINNIRMVKTSDNFYLFQPLEANEQLYVNGDSNTAVRHTFGPQNGRMGNANAGVYIRTVNGQKLVSADAENTPILSLVTQASEELGKNYSIYSAIKGNIDIHVKDISYEEFLNLLFKGTTYTFQSEGGVYLIGDSNLAALKTFKAVQLKNRSIDTVVAMIPADLKRSVQITEFREQNTILLSGSAEGVRQVQQVIQDLDKLVPVVLIEVTMIDVRKSNTIATGITAGTADSIKTGGTILPGVSFTASSASVNNLLNNLGKFTGLNLGHVSPNFYATINALESNNNADVRSIPKLTALNGHTAMLSIGSKLYYKNTTQNLIPSSATISQTVTNIYTPVEADLSLKIKPIVSGNDQVTLNIEVDISDFTSIPSDGSPPPESISKFNSSLRMHSDDTILLGGIERTEHDLNSSGVPLLSRIPILKWIFSSRTKTASKVTTILLIKASILR